VGAHTRWWLLAASASIAAGMLIASPATAAVSDPPPAPPIVASTTYPSDATGLPARTPGTFTFTPPADSDIPATYVYSLNSPLGVIPPDQVGPFPGGARIVAAGGYAPTSVVITPHRVGANFLYVYAIDAAGRVGFKTTYSFATSVLPAPDPYGDVTGDGIPDLLEVGPANRPGLWLYPGTDRKGHVAPTGIQLGARGLDFVANSTHTAADWVGTTIGTADMDDDGIQDFVVRVPHSVGDSNVQVFLGGSDRYLFDAELSMLIDLPSIDSTPASQAVDQIAASPGSSINGLPLPDLYAVMGDDLYLYSPIFPTGAFDSPQLIGSGWSGRTITAAVAAGNPALFSRDNRTGRLDLWVGDAANGVPAGSPTGTRYQYARHGFDANEVSTLTGADINLDGKPDLWAACWGRTLSAYLGVDNHKFGKPVVSNLK
jgi:hypothetical protein